MKIKRFITVLSCLFIMVATSFAGPGAPPQGQPILTEVQTSVTVTNASSVIAAADTFGRNVFVQNNDATGIVYLNLSGTAVADGTMITLAAGGDSITIPNITNAIEAIGSIASNANVVVIED